MHSYTQANDTELTSIEISIDKQMLTLYRNEKLIQQYAVSTAKNGVGERINSECTPRGQHCIAEKIGANASTNAVFVGRVETGEIYQPALRLRYPDRDWILTRILRLRGLEAGKNQGYRQGVCVDSYQRYIYIHGSPDEAKMGEVGSHGCIRMHNHDIIGLFDSVNVGTHVTITTT